MTGRTRRTLRHLVEAAVRGASWVADYAFVVRWQMRSLLRRRPAWAEIDAARTGTPVILLPGIFESWRFLEPLGRELARAGHPIHVVGLGLNSRPIPTLARRVGALARESDLTDAVIVAHSRGGLIGKQVMLDEVKREQRHGTPPRIRGMVTINTPFGGSRYARLIPMASVRAMSPTELATLSAQREVDASITSIYASWDPHVPEGSALVGATNLRVPHRGHFRLLGLAPVHRSVIEAVGRTGR